MLPASNRGPGQALNFPDVCKTPAPPAPFVPIPYPDLGMNMQAAPFSPFVQVGYIPATNMGSLKTMTSGDEAGAMGGVVSQLIKGPGQTTMGNPLVLVTGLPGETLANPTSGNMMNAPVGAQIVPSVINVLYTYRADGEAALGLGELTEVACGDDDVTSCWLADGVAQIRIERFSSLTDRDVFNALRHLGWDAITSLVIDVRGNPGGDAHAAIRLASAFVPDRTTLLLERDADGDVEPVVTYGEPLYPWPLEVRIDGGTASAAELFAAALGHLGRATLTGEPSYGKATGVAFVGPPLDAQLRTVAEFLLPDGGAIDGVGVAPHGRGDA